VIDEEVSKIIEKAYERAKDLLMKNKEKLDQLAKKLLDKEVIFKDDLEEILGARPYGDSSGSPLQPAFVQN
jgi:cell division protease FtsH